MNEDKLREMYELRYGSYPTEEELAHLRVYDGGWYDDYVRECRSTCMSIHDTWLNEYGLDWLEYKKARGEYETKT